MANTLGNRKKLLASGRASASRHIRGDGTNGLGPPYTNAAVAYHNQESLQIGLTVNRTYLDWSSINPSSGVFNWATTNGQNPDLWYSSMVAAGLTPFFQHIFSPLWWQQGRGTNWTSSSIPRADSPPFPGADYDYWKARNVDAMTAAATRYPLAVFSINNEWNQPSIYWRPGGVVTSVSNANYADLHAALQAAAKAVNPTQKVLVGALLRIDSTVSGTSGIGTVAPLKTALDALGCTPDGFEIHPYMLGATNSNPMVDRGPNAIGVNSWQSVERFLKAMDAAGYTLPVYVSESGFRASQSNSQGAFNCNSETTKTIWNRFELDSTFYLYQKDARKSGQSWVESYMYYRMEEYASPTTPTYAGMFSGDPDGGPHAQYPWGVSAQDYYTKVSTHQPIPKLESIILTGVPSTAVIGQTAVAISASGGNIPNIPTFRTSDTTVVSVGTPTVGTAATTISFVGSGTATIVAESRSACNLPISAVQTIVVAAQIPTVSVLSPASGWKVATSNSGTIQFTVTVTDQIGNPIVSPVGTYTSSDPTNFPIDPVTGLGTAIGLSANVTVTYTPSTGTASGRIATSTGDVVLNPVLQITNAPTSLINVGAVSLTITDGASPVTGCTVVISDPAQATATGQDLFGLGTSGSFTIKVQHAGYTDSSLATVTCTGGGYLDDKDGYGFTNGQSISTATDAGGYTWAQATGTKQPTAATNDINGHTSFVYDGVDDYLQATTAVAALNGTGITYASLRYPTSAAPAANEQHLDNRDTTNSQGFVFGRATTTNNIISYYTAISTLTQRFDSAAMAQNTWIRVIDRLDQGAQSRMLNGVIVGTSGVDATYRNPTTAPARPTKSGAIFLSGGNAAERVALEIIVNRAATDPERLQIDQRLKLYGAL